LIEKYKSDCLQCGLDAEEKKKKPKTEVIAMPKTDVVEMKKTKDKIDLKIIEVISVREGKDVLKAVALENQIARRQDKECELLHVAVAVVQLHVMGALNTSALSSASHQHVIVKEDVKSVVQDHRWLCPLFTAQEKGDSMLLFDYTDIFCEMFVSGSDDGHGNHVEPITADQYIRLYTDVQAMTKNTINREYNNGGLVDGASMYRHDVLQYTTTNALEANDGLDVIGLYKW
jgi:hypothetical protein